PHRPPRGGLGPDRGFAAAARGRVRRGVRAHPPQRPRRRQAPRAHRAQRRGPALRAPARLRGAARREPPHGGGAEGEVQDLSAPRGAPCCRVNASRIIRLRTSRATAGSIGQDRAPSENAMSRASSSQHTTRAGAGHSRWVRVTHWIVAASVLTLAVSGFTILMAHPRLYWGAVGNDLTPALLELPVSRNYRHGGWAIATQSFPDGGSAVSAVRTYGILNQDGWARSLHFLAAWFLVVTGAAYLLAGMFGGSQSARTIHFCVFALLLLFVVVHVVMVATSGFGRQMRAMTFGEANMNSECVITSRRTLITGLASAGGLLLGGCSETEPP